MRTRPSHIVSSAALTRRELLHRILPLLTLGASGRLHADEPFPYLFLGSGHTSNLPLIGCNSLVKEIESIERELKLIDTHRLQYGQTLRLDFVSRRASLRAAIKEAKTDATAANIEKIVAAVGLGLSVVLIGIGASFTAPWVVGTVVAVQLLSAPVLMSAQAIAKSSAGLKVGPSILLGYTQERTFVLGELIAENAGSSSGKMVTRMLSAAGLLIGAYQWYQAADTQQQALTSLKLATADLETVDKYLERFGGNDAAWANARENVLEGARDQLKEYVSATSRWDCRAPAIIHPG